MNPELPLSLEVTRLARAIRFAFVSFIVALSYFNISTVSAVPGFMQIFRDMLNGKPLPAMTMFVIHAEGLLLVVAWLIPLTAIGTLWTRRLIASFYLLGGLCLLTLVLFVFLYHALSAPLFQIITSMQGG